MNQWEKIARKSTATATQIVRATLIQMTNSVIRLSPVDRGRFVNNWNSSINTENLSTNDSLDESRSKSLGKASQEVSKVSVGDTFYFYNNLPYAIPLEYGHSDQARSPDGMVRITVAQFKSIVERVSK